jgi:hypothetical protein
MDISKLAISANLVGRGDAYAGPVIVKTNCNYGGVPERRLKPDPPRRSLLRRIVGKASSLLRSKRAADDLAGGPWTR